MRIHASAHYACQINTWYIGFHCIGVIIWTLLFIIGHLHAELAKQCKIGMITRHGKYPIVFYCYNSLQSLDVHVVVSHLKQRAIEKGFNAVFLDAVFYIWFYPIFFFADFITAYH